MNTNIYFVRHAHSMYTPDELERPLSEKGFEDTKKVTKLLSRERITYIVSSPYKRAIQTVEGIANHFQLDISIDNGFRERKIADSSVDNFHEVVLKYWENFDFAIQRGESGWLAQDRGIKSLNNILEKYSGGNIVVGTHGNIMVLIMNYYDKKYNYDFWRNLAMPDIYRLSFEKRNLIEVERIWE